MADVESEESAMTEEIVENLLKRKAKKQKKKLQDDIAPLKTPKKEIPTPGTPKIPVCMKKRAKKQGLVTGKVLHSSSKGSVISSKTFCFIAS